MKTAVPSLIGVMKNRGVEVSTDSPLIDPNWNWIQDSGIMLADPNNPDKKIILTSTVTPELFQASRNEATRLSGKNGALGDASGLGNAFMEGASLRMNERLKKAGWGVRETPLAIDGGNLIPMMDKDGKPLMLLGFDSLLVNTQLLKSGNFMDQRIVSKILKGKAYNPDYVKKFLDVEPLSGPRMTLEQAQTAAAELELTRHYIAKTLNVLPDQLKVIDQLATFHIDMIMRPIMPGVVMLADQRLSQKVLDRLLKEIESSDPYKNSKDENDPIRNEHYILTRFRKRQNHAFEAGDEHNKVDRSVESLEKAGLKVIRAPLSFGYIVNPNEPWPANANVANGFVAVDHLNRPYFVTNDTGSPKLNEEIVKFMQPYGIEVDLVKVGELLNQLGGIQCSVLFRKGKSPLIKN